MHLSTSRQLVVGLGGILVANAGVQAQGAAPYTLSAAYDRSNFFDKFDFFTEQDPTHGFVEYVDQATAQQEGLIGYGGGNSSGGANFTSGLSRRFNPGYGQGNGSVFIGVDHKTVNPANGRRSVRVTSQKSFTHGLFIADIAHMPGSTCGVWPAYWMFGPNWPTSGEIDIIEGVNSQQKGTVTLHTKPGCSIDNSGSISSSYLKSSDCGASGTSAGCGQDTADPHNYGDGFNAIRGGVYATEWTSDHIAVWFFPRSSIPRDITAGRPDPSSWGQPAARFNGGNGCNIDDNFANNQIVFNTAFCGDWAGQPSVWGSDKTCAAKAATCNDYVAANPDAFRDAYWEINSVKVYDQGQGRDGPQTPSPTQALPSAPTQLPGQPGGGRLYPIPTQPYQHNVDGADPGFIPSEVFAPQAPQGRPWKA
ncbi:hypothetical protein HIM_01793 [Hirsutella minnesotensis 3608]|nr:hypothetical protein HIM_01793 [Hirsutella minnesotensis 3608]